MKTMTAMNSNRTGRRYDREFKNNAVALVRSARTVTDVARDLGVSKWSLGRWVEQARAGQVLSEAKTLAAETPEQRELRRLRQELEYVSRQRDILKKGRASRRLAHGHPVRGPQDRRLDRSHLPAPSPPLWLSQDRRGTLRPRGGLRAGPPPQDHAPAGAASHPAQNLRPQNQRWPADKPSPNLLLDHSVTTPASIVLGNRIPMRLWSSMPLQVEPSQNTNKIPVSTFSLANGGRPLLDLGRVWELTFYGNYMLGQFRHEREEVRSKVHAKCLT